VTGKAVDRVEPISFDRYLERSDQIHAILVDRAFYERQVEASDRQIDALVYELNGQTGEEIAIVEGTTAQTA
jgi:hypothetical protein